MKFFKIALIVLISTYLSGQHVPSKERGDYNYRRQTDIDGNKVRTSIFNWGLTGRPVAGPQYIPYEWPKNSGHHYIACTGFWVGAEVFDVDNIKTKIISVSEFRTNSAGESWTFNPVPGYLNKSSDLIAKSDVPDSWPPSWPDKEEDENDPGWRGSWNGYFGKNQFNADQELYFKVSDDCYDRYRYYPDSTDLTRGGLGILAGVRVMQWSQILVEDVVFFLYEIKNDGTKDLDKVCFALRFGDMVGGDGDGDDDMPDFDLLNDIAWSKDADGIGNAAFGTDPVGVPAMAYLETPGNSVDRIDNDGDGEANSPKVTLEMIEGEVHNRIDDNGNGLVDEDSTHVPFGHQVGVGYADRIDNNGNGEANSPIVTKEMVDDARSDKWKRWPPFPESDTLQAGEVHLIGVGSEDVGCAFKDNIDNNGNGEDNSPVITQAIIDIAANDSPYYRYKVPDAVHPKYGTPIILYNVTLECLGFKYADGIDNDGDGAIDEGIDENIDEMIDESRDDFVDNDGDWNPYFDDVGLDGAPLTNDEGEGDGIPTSGAGTNLPGESNIDKTDASESDQMGITSVQYRPAMSGIFRNSDNVVWDWFLTPGSYYPIALEPLVGNYALVISSGYFPLKAGRTERISMAICLGEDVPDVIRNKDLAQKTYEEDYQFAKAPIPPNVTAVAGDGKVTLYWDDIAERSFDDYMHEIGSPGYDFEGYKIYRATDTQFQDVYEITDAQGNLTFYSPIARWDLKDGIKGYHPVDINGVLYDLGNDTGIQHTYVDSTVQNGQTYYYAVVSYDFGGDLTNSIPPTECNIPLVIDHITGEVRKGPNVVIVTPEAPSAGYEEADIIDIELVQGITSSTVGYRIVDPLEVLDRHTYRITFEDTIKPKKGSKFESGYDTLATKSFTLEDITELSQPITLISKSQKITKDDEQPVIDGFQLVMRNEDKIEFNSTDSYWSRDSLWRFDVNVFYRGYTNGRPYPADYKIEIGEAEIDTSTEYCGFPSSVFFPSVPVNFTVKKRVSLTGNDEIDWEEIPFAFGDYSPFGSPDGLLGADSTRESDWVVFLDDTTEGGDLSPTWVFTLNYPVPGEPKSIYKPQSGDTAFIAIKKPYLSTDIFEFTTYSSYIDTLRAKEELKKIKVVPNPYFAAATWESKNPYVSGRGPRSIHFNHLPAKCTIRIFTVSGELVKEIKHESFYNDGSEEWDLLTMDNLSASYGIYIYHIEAPGIGEHIGKFAIIK